MKHSRPLAPDETVRALEAPSPGPALSPNPGN
jgi:hypothetical protein